MNEDQLITFLQDLHPIHSIDEREVDRTKEFWSGAGTVSNSFSSKKLNGKLSAFRKELENLLIFMNAHFINMDNAPSTQQYLEPYFRTGRDPSMSVNKQLEFHNQCAEELSKLAQSVNGAYREYRKAIQEELKV